MCDGHQTEETRRFHWTPFTAGAVRQGHHDCLQVLANNFELANALEFHRFARQILSWCHCVSKYVQEEGTTARSVHSECNHISHNRLLKNQILGCDIKELKNELLIYFVYLHDEALQADSFECVGIIVVEFQVVMENETGLHVGRHTNSNSYRS